MNPYLFSNPNSYPPKLSSNPLLTSFCFSRNFPVTNPTLMNLNPYPLQTYLPVYQTPYIIQIPVHVDAYDQLRMQQQLNCPQEQTLQSQQHHLSTDINTFTQPLGQSSSLSLEKFSCHTVTPNEGALSCDLNKSAKAHIKDIVYFFLNNASAASYEKTREEKERYKAKKELLPLFEALYSKYVSETKTREDLIVNLLLSAVKYMKQKINKETDYKQITPDKQSFNDFLKALSAKIKKCTVNQQKPHNPVQFDKKKISHFNSKITQLIDEAFSSKEFIQEFQYYANNLDQRLELDNNKKFDKFVQFLESSLTRNIIKEIKRYKRVPWPNTWISATKEVAMELIANYETILNSQDRKRVKYEENSSTTKEEDSTETLGLGEKIEESYRSNSGSGDD